MSPDELAYYRNRAHIERELAARSTNSHVAEIHTKLADLYDKLVAIEGGRRGTLSIVA
jgi:hypothetical protein